MLLTWLGKVAVLVLTCTVFVHSKKTQCSICKDIVQNFQKGLEKTMKSNFGGGNTNWEEKSLGKWKTSETRLVEIVEHHICDGNEKQCHMFYENNEEAIEEWYFNIYKDLDSADGLHDYLCVATAKACCPAGTFGKECKPCPSHEGQICGGKGTCKGDGTHEGDGTCKCDKGYTGDVCDECSDDHFEQLTGSIKVCVACDPSCDDTCQGDGPKGCDDCKKGYTWDDTKGCQDDDECMLDEHPCYSEDKPTYCVNTIGSYRCGDCHSSCASCTDEKVTDCTECETGYEKTTPDGPTTRCKDVDECTLLPALCDHVKGSQCHNTAGSFECKCADTQTLEGDACIDKQPDANADAGAEEQPVAVDGDSTAANDETTGDESIEKSDKGKEESKTSKEQSKKLNTKSKTDATKSKKAETKSKKAESKKWSKEKPVEMGSNGQPKINIDEMVNEAGKLPPGQKRKYRTLDSMTYASGIGLYLVMCLVFRAEFFKTSLVTIVLAIFIYKYSGQYQ